MQELASTQLTEKTVKKLINAAVNCGPKLIYAVILLLIGLYVCKWAKKSVRNFALKYNIDRGIANFASYAIYIVGIVAVVVTCLDMIGFPVQSFMTVMASLVGVIGLSLGLAFKEIISNLGSGMIILFFKPFKTGDYIAGSGVEGTVYEIQIFSTVLKTPDNKTIIVPNLKLTSDNIINYTHQRNRRIDFSFKISYDSNIKLVKEIIDKVFKDDNRILEEPKTIIGLNMLGDNSMQVVARPWVKTEDYWDVYYDMMEKIKLKFDENNIKSPFPSKMLYYENIINNVTNE